MAVHCMPRQAWQTWQWHRCSMTVPSSALSSCHISVRSFDCTHPTAMCIVHRTRMRMAVVTQSAGLGSDQSHFPVTCSILCCHAFENACKLTWPEPLQECQLVLWRNVYQLTPAWWCLTSSQPAHCTQNWMPSVISGHWSPSTVDSHLSRLPSIIARCYK